MSLRFVTTRPGRPTGNQARDQRCQAAPAGTRAAGAEPEHLDGIGLVAMLQRPPAARARCPAGLPDRHRRPEEPGAARSPAGVSRRPSPPCRRAHRADPGPRWRAVAPATPADRHLQAPGADGRPARRRSRHPAGLQGQRMAVAGEVRPPGRRGHRPCARAGGLPAPGGGGRGAALRLGVRSPGDTVFKVKSAVGERTEVRTAFGCGSRHGHGPGACERPRPE